MSLTVDRVLKQLGRTITPYRGQTIIISGITIFTAFVAHRSSQWRIFWWSTGIWALFAVLIYIGLQYRVLWDGNGVVMRASGIKERRIQYDEITEIRVERADFSEFFAQSRPFRRIVVYGHKNHSKAYIDISLRHFRPQDIDELLTRIRIHRPDLEVPVIPWGTGSL